MLSRRENSLKFADSILNDIVRWVFHLLMIAGVIMQIKSMKTPWAADDVEDEEDGGAADDGGDDDDDAGGDDDDEWYVDITQD